MNHTITKEIAISLIISKIVKNQSNLPQNNNTIDKTNLSNHH
jgi:hypothetical protein